MQGKMVLSGIYHWLSIEHLHSALYIKVPKRK